MEIQQPQDSKDKELKQLLFTVYILQAVFFLFVITPVFGLILNYIKKSELSDSAYYTHYRWQQNTFWFGLAWSILGIMTIPMLLIGYVVLFFLTLWYVYRIAKGWIYLSDGKAMYE